MRIELATAALMLVSLAQADEIAQIVTTCHFGNAEWGNDAIHRCIDENRAVREEMLRLPGEDLPALERCRRSADLGWYWVKACVGKDAAARIALRSYPSDTRLLIEACTRELAPRGFVSVKACVDDFIKKSGAR